MKRMRARMTKKKWLRAVVSVQSNRFSNAEYISQFMQILIGFAYNDYNDNPRIFYIFAQCV